MTPRTVVTIAMREHIRKLRKLKVPYAVIARDMGLNYETVRRHASDINAKAIATARNRRYEREKLNPEIVERRRKTAREYDRKQREMRNAAKAGTVAGAPNETATIE